MTQDEANTKVDELQKTLAEMVTNARNEIAKRQQALQEFIRLQQSGIDNLQGKISVYKDVLSAKPKEALLDAQPTKQNEKGVFEPMTE